MAGSGAVPSAGSFSVERFQTAPQREMLWRVHERSVEESPTPRHAKGAGRTGYTFFLLPMDSNPTEMAPQFDPHPVERKWSATWSELEIGKPNCAPDQNHKPFVLTIPPPNVTGVLHLGHALQHSIHDCLLRYHRMKGDATLCIPGTDHAGIATQIKVEQLLRSEGISRHTLGREDFLKRVWEWKEKYGATIIEQMHALGCSYDWSRERFTMDEGYVRAVLTVFKSWFDRGLIYRGFRLVNWSSGAGTTVSDLEIEQKEIGGQLTYIRYPVEDNAAPPPQPSPASGRGSIEFVTVATTRPETMLGDTAVAVHPDDPRYSHLRGRNVVLPLMNRAIPIVFDESVDREFGTGAVKITPAHDPSDYEMGTRHGLPMISVIGFDDKITADGGDYAGMNKLDARKKIIADLRTLDAIEKIEPITHSVPHCARTGVVIEPLLSEQWFVSMKELARPVADAIRMNRVTYHAPRFGQTSLEWLDNIRDWCISRQLWWGHRIPIYYGPNGEVECSIEPIEREGWHQDPDVLDTWFSSALWPFAVLGWPDALEREWYPTSVLITGRDILNLWVSRMILTSLDYVKAPPSSLGSLEKPPPQPSPASGRGSFSAGQVPFHDVLVHPTIQDTFGQRMSKSLGTGIDPLELISLYGADATRYGLLQLAGGAQDTRFLDGAMSKMGDSAVRKWIREHRGEPLPLEWNDSDGKPTERFPQMQAARNFANKIWNASRLVLSAESGAPTKAEENSTKAEESFGKTEENSGKAEDFFGKAEESFGKTEESFGKAEEISTPEDLGARWISSRLNSTIRDVTRALDSYEFDSAAQSLYSFIWGDFCDWFLELSKPKMRPLPGHCLDVVRRPPQAGEGDVRAREEYIAFMRHILDCSLRLLHPFMPFLSDEIWSRLPHSEGEAPTLALSHWPVAGEVDVSVESDFALLQETVRAARNLKVGADIAPSKLVALQLFPTSERALSALQKGEPILKQLANIESVQFGGERAANATSFLAGEVEVVLPLEGLIDVAKERAKIEKQLEGARKDFDKVNAKLSNPNFAANAPAEVVAKDRARLAELQSQIETLEARLGAL